MWNQQFGIVLPYQRNKSVQIVQMQKKLFFKTFNEGAYKKFREQIENNPEYPDFADCLAHGFKLVKNKSMTGTLLELAPTMIMLLQYGANWYGGDLVCLILRRRIMCYA